MQHLPVTRIDRAEAPTGPGPPRAAGPRSPSWWWAGLVVVVLVVGALVWTRTSKRVEVHRFDAAGLRSVDVATHVGSVRVTAGPVAQVEVRAVIRTSRRTAEVTAEASGDTLVVRQACSGGWGRCSVGFEVTVPQRFATVARTSNGEVRADGIGGDADLRTSNGAIRASGLNAAHVRAVTSNGAIRLAFAGAPKAVEATTANGGITVGLPRDGSTYRIDAGSRNGGVESRVEADPTSHRSIVAHTRNGGVLIVRGEGPGARPGADEPDRAGA